MWKFCSTEASAVRAKAPISASKLLPGDSVRIGALACVDAGLQWFAFTLPDGQAGRWTAIHHMLMTQRCLAGKFGLASQPLRGMAQLLTVWLGSAVIMVLPPSQAFQASGEFVKYLSEVTYDEVRGFFSTFVEDGDSVWVPPGFMAVWIGIPPEQQIFAPKPQLAIRGRKQVVGGVVQGPPPSTHKVTIGAQVFLNVDSVPSMQDDICKMLLASNALGKAGVPREIKEHAKWLRFFMALDAKVESGGNGRGAVGIDVVAGAHADGAAGGNDVQVGGNDVEAGAHADGAAGGNYVASGAHADGAAGDNDVAASGNDV